MLLRFLVPRKAGGWHGAVALPVHLLYGAGLGFALHLLLVSGMGFQPAFSRAMLAVLCSMLALAMALSSQMRCISLLAVPSMSGRAGRGVLKALVVAHVVAGPLQNLLDNGAEVVRVFACTTALSYNLTLARYQLMYKPFHEALFGLKGAASGLQDTFAEVPELAQPIVGEVEGRRKAEEFNEYSEPASSRPEDYEKAYARKLEERCREQLNRGVGRCRQAFADVFSRCMGKLGWLGHLLCWPLKMTSVCNLMRWASGPDLCDPRKDLDLGFGQSYATLKKLDRGFGRSMHNLTVEVVRPQPASVDFDLGLDRQTVSGFVHSFERKKELLVGLLQLLQRLLVLVSIRVIFVAVKYHDGYLTDVGHDNVYVTGYFRKLDARRWAARKLTLLPLRKAERKALLLGCSARPQPWERAHMSSESLKLVLEALAASIFLLLDSVLAEALQVVRDKGRVDYVQTGRHDLKLQIHGSSVVATMLRALIRGFEVRKRLRVARTNAACLPRPKRLPSAELYTIYGMYAFIWLLIQVQAYTLRLRHSICGMFYPAMEKRRILFLYNKTLRGRIHLHRNMKRRAKMLAAQHKLEEYVTTLEMLSQFRLLKFLRRFPSARRKCLICREPEPYNAPYDHCPNPDCPFVHCVECWNDLGRKCLVCDPNTTPSTTDLDDE